MEQINIKVNKTFLEQGMITIPNEFAKSILRRDCRELNLLLRKEFIQTYIKLKSQELSIESENFYGTEEVVSIKIKGKNSIQFSPYIKSKTPYDAL